MSFSSPLKIPRFYLAAIFEKDEKIEDFEFKLKELKREIDRKRKII